eukprot:6563503-Pyramimonas_sp.AAC.2
MACSSRDHERRAWFLVSPSPWTADVLRADARELVDVERGFWVAALEEAVLDREQADQRVGKGRRRGFTPAWKSPKSSPGRLRIEGPIAENWSVMRQEVRSHAVGLRSAAHPPEAHSAP